jgi:PilZ domain
MCRVVGEPDFIQVRCLNISQSGMLLAGQTLPAIGADLEFKFVLESGIVILSGKGKIMRHASEVGGAVSFGVAFSEEDPPNPRILARVIELHSEVDDGD